MDGPLMGVGWSGWYFRVWRIPYGNCGCSIDSDFMYCELALQEYVKVERYMIWDLIVDLFKVAGRQCAICFFYICNLFIAFLHISILYIYIYIIYIYICLQLRTGVACIRYALEVWCDAVFLEHFCQQNHCKQVVRISGCILIHFYLGRFWMCCWARVAVWSGLVWLVVVSVP